MAKKKTTIEKLQQAIAKGDLARIKELGDLLAKESDGDLALPRSRPLARAKATRPPAPLPNAGGSFRGWDDGDDDEVLESIPVEDEGDDALGEYNPANSAWMAPSRKSTQDVRTKVLDDGRVVQFARRVSMKGQGVVNQFKDSGKGGYDNPRHARLDKANGRKDAAIDRRPPTRKRKVACQVCRVPHAAYPSEMTEVREEDGRRSLVFVCERCIAGRGRH